jgi:hypothetical protein
MLNSTLQRPDANQDDSFSYHVRDLYRKTPNIFEILEKCDQDYENSAYSRQRTYTDRRLVALTQPIFVKCFQSTPIFVYVLRNGLMSP